MTCPRDESDVMCDGNGECFRLGEQRDELLVALKAVVSMHCRDLKSGTYQDRIGAMAQARAAIAKAEGRVA